jgi:hypothetical protein
VYASGTLSVVNDAVTITPAQNTPIGPDTAAVVGLSGTHSGASVAVEGRIGSGSVWYPIGTVTGDTFAPTNGDAYALGANESVALRGNVAGYSELRARLTAIGSGSVAAEVTTQPAGSVAGSGGTVIATIPATATFSGGITFNGTTGNNVLSIPDNLADALNIKEGSNSYIQIVSTDGSEAVQIKKNLALASDASAAQAIAAGTTNGLKIGTATTQKLGFYNATPIVQRSGAAQAAVATTSATNSSPYGYSQAQADGIVTLLNEIRAALVAVGIIKGSA